MVLSLLVLSSLHAARVRDTMDKERETVRLETLVNLNLLEVKNTQLQIQMLKLFEEREKRRYKGRDSTLCWVNCGSQCSTGITSWLLESRGATFLIFFGLGMVSFVGKGQVALLKV